MNRYPFWMQGAVVGTFIGALCFILFVTTSLNPNSFGLFLQPGFLAVNLLAYIVPSLAESNAVFFSLGLVSFVVPYTLLGVLVGAIFFRRQI